MSPSTNGDGNYGFAHVLRRTRPFCWRDTLVLRDTRKSSSSWYHVRESFHPQSRPGILQTLSEPQTIISPDAKHVYYRWKTSSSPTGRFIAVRGCQENRKLSAELLLKERPAGYLAHITNVKVGSIELWLSGGDRKA